MKNPFKKYINSFSETSFWNKLTFYARKAGVKTIYSALLLYYAFRRKETPLWAKNIILGALGYFISPIDSIPDLTPILGYTDDIGIMSFGLVMIASYVNDEVRGKAKDRLFKWFGEVDDQELNSVDEVL